MPNDYLSAKTESGKPVLLDLIVRLGHGWRGLAEVVDGLREGDAEDLKELGMRLLRDIVRDTLHIYDEKHSRSCACLTWY